MTSTGRLKRSGLSATVAVIASTTAVLVLDSYQIRRQTLILALLVPMVSLVIDTILIFAVWEFVHRKVSPRVGSEDSMGVNR